MFKRTCSCDINRRFDLSKIGRNDDDDTDSVVADDNAFRKDISARRKFSEKCQKIQEDKK